MKSTLTHSSDRCKQQQGREEPKLTHIQIAGLIKILRELQMHKMSWPFREPGKSDSETDVIKEPMGKWKCSMNSSMSELYRFYLHFFNRLKVFCTLLLSIVWTMVGIFRHVVTLRPITDLSTIHKKFQKKHYPKLTLFVKDVLRVFSNARQLYSEDSQRGRCADTLERYIC